MTSEALRDRLDGAIRDSRARLVSLSRDIHGYAEPSFAEHRAAARVRDELARAGFEVTEGVADLPTAFTARFGSGDFVVGVCAEYDALPEIGHACGHNIIAAAAVGAAIGLAAVADELGLTVEVVGCPAEEHGGGKVLMLERGCFDHHTVALMVHPGTADADPATTYTQGVSRFAATFSGRAAHAAAAPTDGVNAGDAAVVAQVAVGLLRQQLPATARVGLFVRDGGQATNIIPERTIVDFEVREFDLERLHDLRGRVRACFEAGALATGCTVEFEETEPEYAPLLQDTRLARPFADAVRGLGRTVQDASGMTGGSTDMGNVSQYLPSIHPMIDVKGSGNPPHTRAFADDAVAPGGDDAAIDGAIAMARAIADVASDPSVRRGLLAEQAERAPYAALAVASGSEARA
ncbi:amidohydrolase [Zhihengliuella sp.]|uniref:amidohydrolase n=1 Tax=Zhihengliuella sp. TaxID=1954483 RepID=UPI0028110D1F|nr:amidohydrolase [Zhihengliuella sp.]